MKRTYTPKPCPECKEPMRQKYVEESPMSGYYRWACENPECDLETVRYRTDKRE